MEPNKLWLGKLLHAELTPNADFNIYYDKTLFGTIKRIDGKLQYMSNAIFRTEDPLHTEALTEIEGFLAYLDQDWDTIVKNDPTVTYETETE